MATLLEMTQTHVPVLAAELIELLDPQPGAVVVDCTVGGEHGDVGLRHLKQCGHSRFPVGCP